MASPSPNILGSEAVKLRIAKGDITQEDVDMLSRSYTIMTTAMGVGFATGIPVWFIARRRGVPPLTSIAAASTTSILGSFLATSVGGAVAALDIKKNMPDYDRKMRVFQEITVDVTRAMQEQRAGIKPGTIISHQAGVPGPDVVWTPPADQQPTDSESFPDQPPPSAVGQALEQNGSNAWDRLRANKEVSRAGAPAARGRGGDASPEEEYARRQKEFDAMLERERQGGNEADTWK